MIEDVYSAVVALCSVSVAILLIFGVILGAYFALKVYDLYCHLFVNKNNKKGK